MAASLLYLRDGTGYCFNNSSQKTFANQKSGSIRNSLQKKKMASKVTKSHLRSNSLPSSPHPLNSNVEEQLQWLRSSEAASSSSASSACQKLAGLGDLYNCVDDWLQLSLIQKALSNGIHRQTTENLLEGSLAILDVCGSLREVFLKMKESVRELESSLRRRGVESGSVKEIESYLTSRKKMKKLISNSFESLKKMEKQNVLNHGEAQEEAALNILRETQRLSTSVFQSVLCFVSRPRSRSSSWSFVSKALSSKRIVCEDSNELEHLDIELLGLKSDKASSVQVRKVQIKVEALESSIREIEEVSESVFRCLVKMRVSLLNSLNH